MSRYTVSCQFHEGPGVIFASAICLLVLPESCSFSADITGIADDLKEAWRGSASMYVRLLHHQISMGCMQRKLFFAHLCPQASIQDVLNMYGVTSFSSVEYQTCHHQIIQSPSASIICIAGLISVGGRPRWSRR